MRLLTNPVSEAAPAPLLSTQIEMLHLSLTKIDHSQLAMPDFFLEML